ncbi:UNVERIFIED_CONTAM: Chlorophyll(ide) b reductase NOL, chloroplastic [Sesamum radiatum]|uniref:Chlorophyll(Ide) b reductase NOL, chloroplastic n=1 Tax=Sesamum radiatum TaxID=300843 RepID=A0AAW2UCJ0_SESRA
MVTTDLLMSGANTKQAKFFINVLAEPAEVVAQYLIPNIRAIPTNGSGRPTYIRFLTGLKAYSQIFSRRDLLLVLGEIDMFLKISTHTEISAISVHPLHAMSLIKGLVFLCVRPFAPNPE